MMRSFFIKNSELGLNPTNRLKSLLPACPRLRKRLALLTTGSLLTPLMASLLVPVMPPPLPAAPAAEEMRVVNLSLPLAEAPTDEEPPAPTPPVDEKASPWQNETVRRNDTLGSVFQRLGLSQQEAYRLSTSSKRAKQIVSQLRPGQQVQVLLDAQQQVEQVRLVNSRLSYSEFARQPEGSYRLNEVLLTPDILYSFAEATIDQSLFQSASDAGIPDRLTMKLADIFGWDVDFVQDIRSGDSFHIVYEQLYLNGEHIGDGEIVAAEFRNQGQTFQALRYTYANGESSYFTPEGQSMRKEFLRSPIEFARISSHFNLKRKHPVLHTIRAHKGTDYAASRGTPIRATGDGRVEFAGTKGGYGKMVILQHGQSYETRYGHMQNYARGIRSGARVKQGQVIGYVGSSGLATGPHLHYEFHVNGSVRNPVTVKFPKSEAISAREKPRFLAQTSRYQIQLASFLGRPLPAQLASAN